MAMTLEELKAANAKAEAAATDENVEHEEDALTPPQVEKDKSDGAAAEDDTKNGEEGAESSEDEDGELDVEDWKQGDSHESQAGQEKKFTDSDIGKAKAKLRAKLEKRHESELDELRKEVAELKGRPQAKALERPKREDFEDADDPDEAYFEALTDWKLTQHKSETQAQQASEQTKQQQEQWKAQTEKAVDQHYERAVELAEQSGISAEMYQSADLRVRQTVEAIFPEAGDTITDALIANLGEGSEKVMYNLGINTARREEFKSLLLEDRTGIKAAMYLAERKAELNAPRKRKTSAPKPAPNLNGDKQTGANHKALKQKYDKAHEKGDLQAAFNFKREAKKAGADTANW